MLITLARVLTFAKRIPWQVWAALAAIIALWAWGNHREAQGRYEGRAEVQAQWDKAKAEGERIRRAEEARQANLTKEADRAVIENTANERDRAERFIAAGGVREGRCPRTVPAEVPSTGEREGVHPAPVMDDADTVQVPADDIRICTNNTVKVEAFRELLLGLEG